MIGLEDRVERLERENRWLKAAALVAVLGVGTVFLMGQAGYSDEIKARMITLLDSDGIPRVILNGAADHPALGILGSAGDVVLAAGADGPRLVLSDANGNRRAELDVNTLTLADTNGTIRILLTGAAGGPNFSLLDADGTPGVFLADSPDGAVLSLYGIDGHALLSGQALGLINADGKPRVALRIKDDLPALLLTPNDETNAELSITAAGPTLNLTHPHGSARLGVTANGAALGLIDANGRMAGLKPAGLVLYDAKDNPIWTAP